MANSLGFYDPNFYAATALIQLEKALGLAARVYRGYDKNPQEYGSVINLRRPTYFTAQAMPISSANTTDLTPDSVSITLDQWFGVQFAITDKELSYTQERIVQEHIRPAAIAVSDKIDQSLNSLANKVPWYYVAVNTGTATNQITDWPALGRRLFDNAVPTNDIHAEINGERQQYFLSCDTFNRVTWAGDGGAAQMRGTLGEKFGFEIFANQNVAAQAAGGAITQSTFTVTVAATVTVGQSTVSLAGSTISGNLAVGDIIQIGHAGTDGLTGAARTSIRNYVVATAATVTSNTIVLSVTPKFSNTVAVGVAVTFKVQSTAKYDNLAFHRNWAALAMAPLPEASRMFGNNLGAMVASVSDPTTGLALRATIWYQGIDAKVYVRLDALWGLKVLDEDLACRYIS